MVFLFGALVSCNLHTKGETGNSNDDQHLVVPRDKYRTNTKLDYFLRTELVDFMTTRRCVLAREGSC